MLQKIGVLLIDDDEDIYLIVSHLLNTQKNFDFTIDWEPHYQVGIEKALEGKYDVCLVDYRLKDGSGVELIKTCNQQKSTLPMILLTGEGDHAVDVDAMEAGATDYLAKSRLDAEILERSIRYSIKHKRIEQELLVSKQSVEQKNQIFRSFLETNIVMEHKQELGEVFEFVLKQLHTLFHDWGFGLILEPKQTQLRQENIGLGLILEGDRPEILECAAFEGFLPKEQALILDHTPELLEDHFQEVLEKHLGKKKKKLQWQILPMKGRNNRVIGKMLIKSPWVDQESTDIIKLFLQQIAAVAENKLLTRQLECLSNTDALTQTYNRGYFNRELDREIQKVQQYPSIFFSLFLIDVNGLKRVNDVFGHVAGDQLLVYVSQMLRKVCRRSDRLARLGGDEFVILCPSTNQKQAQSLLRRLREEEETSFIECQHPDGTTEQVPVRLSIGLASSESTPPNDMLKRADRQMYANKEAYYTQHDRYR